MSFRRKPKPLTLTPADYADVVNQAVERIAARLEALPAAPGTVSGDTLLTRLNAVESGLQRVEERLDYLAAQVREFALQLVAGR